MGANFPTPPVENLAVEAEVLSSAEKIEMDAREKARNLFESHPGKSLTELHAMFREQVEDGTERNYALAELMTLTRKRTNEFLAATDFDSADVVRRMNDVLDERDSDVGLIGGAEFDLDIASEEVA